MIAFCTYCFTEIDVEGQRCQNCRIDLEADSRSYEDRPSVKTILEHIDFVKGSYP